jgi:hypothetical protein
MSAAAGERRTAAREPRHQLIERAGAVALRFETLRGQIAGLRAEVAGLQRTVARVQAGEALTRAELTEALLAAMAAQAALRRELRGLAQRLYFAPRPPAPLPFGRTSWRLRRVLARLGAPGQALLIAGSGFWRFSGRPLFDIRRIAAYVRRGADPSLTPPSFFDQAGYLTRNPDVAAQGGAPLAHYLLAGQAERRTPHLLFDAGFYEQRYGETIAASRLWPLAHFVRHGAQAGLDPHPFFDMLHYASQGPVPAPGEDLASHYLREGWRLGLSPHPLFDPGWYQAQAPDSAGMAPLAHFILEGAAAGLSPHPLFDPAWYLEQAPEAADSGLDPLRHFLLVGAARGLSPSPWFDPQHYAVQRGASLGEGFNPLLDYLQGGAWTAAEPAPGFATAAYVAANPDLIVQGLTPLEHWARQAATDRRPRD